MRNPTTFRSTFSRGLCLVCLCFPFLASSAHAYLDPGNGSYLFQMLIGAVLASAYSLKLFGARLKDILTSWFSSQRSKQGAD